MKQTKRVIVFQGEQYDKGFPDSATLLEFKQWVDDRVAEVPEQYRGEATFNLGSTTCYDSHYATIEIGYERPETDQEESKREQEEAARAYMLERRQFAEFLRLNKKFGKAQ